VTHFGEEEVEQAWTFEGEKNSLGWFEGHLVVENTVVKHVGASIRGASAILRGAFPVLWGFSAQPRMVEA
jgi:hypothetical protein